jgi:two-component system response regulator MprA
VVRALVVDPDPTSREALRRALVHGGYEVQSAEDGGQALAAIEGRLSDVVLLDADTPDINGVELCRHVRRLRNHVPIMMLAARAGDDVRIASLEAGADDFMEKPVAPEGLEARIRALRRCAAPSRQFAPLAFAEISLDISRYGAMVSDRFTELTRMEYRLLEMFLLNPRRVLSQGQLLHSVWGYDPACQSNTMRVYIGYLRRKLRKAGARELIHTVRYVGYVLREP